MIHGYEYVWLLFKKKCAVDCTLNMFERSYFIVVRNAHTFLFAVSFKMQYITDLYAITEGKMFALANIFLKIKHQSPQQKQTKQINK